MIEFRGISHAGLAASCSRPADVEIGDLMLARIDTFVDVDVAPPGWTILQGGDNLGRTRIYFRYATVDDTPASTYTWLHDGGVDYVSTIIAYSGVRRSVPGWPTAGIGFNHTIFYLGGSVALHQSINTAEPGCLLLSGFYSDDATSLGTPSVFITRLGDAKYPLYEHRQAQVGSIPADTISVFPGTVSLGDDIFGVLLRPLIPGSVVANAGPNQAVFVDTLVTLTAAASSASNTTIATYAWTQISGPAATLSDDTVESPTFTPTVPGSYIFEVIVTGDPLDGVSTSADTVQINIVSEAAVPHTGVYGGPFLWVPSYTSEVVTSKRVLVSETIDQKRRYVVKSPARREWRLVFQTRELDEMEAVEVFFDNNYPANWVGWSDPLSDQFRHYYINSELTSTPPSFNWWDYRINLLDKNGLVSAVTPVPETALPFNPNYSYDIQAGKATVASDSVVGVRAAGAKSGLRRTYKLKYNAREVPEFLAMEAFWIAYYPGITVTWTDPLREDVTGLWEFEGDIRGTPQPQMMMDYELTLREVL